MLDAGAIYESWEENEEDNKGGQRKIHCARKLLKLLWQQPLA